MKVAGPALIFMGGAVPVYWAFVVLIEMGVFNCKKRGGVQREDLVDAHQGAEQMLLKQNMGDDDVIEEEERIRNGNKNMPVRLECVTKKYGKTTALN